MERQTGSIDTNGGNLKLTISASFLPAGVEDKEALERKTWAQYAPMFGLPADAYGLTIKLGGAPFTLVGMSLKRTKNNVTVRRVSDGKIFLTTHDTVKRQLTTPAA